MTRNTPAFSESVVVPPRRRGDVPDVLATFESPLGSGEGYRIIWIHSTGKKARDATARAARIERSERELSQLASRLAGPKCRTKTRVAAIETAKALLEANGTIEFFELFVCEERDKAYTASHRGRQARRRPSASAAASASGSHGSCAGTSWPG